MTFQQAILEVRHQKCLKRATLVGQLYWLTLQDDCKPHKRVYDASSGQRERRETRDEIKGNSTHVIFCCLPFTAVIRQYI